MYKLALLAIYYIHSVFYIFLLKYHQQRFDKEFKKSSSKIIKSEKKYEIKKIIDHHVRDKKIFNFIKELISERNHIRKNNFFET
jgi:hypothetical protein